MRERCLEDQVKNQMVYNFFESDQNGGYYGGNKISGTHISISGSLIIANENFFEETMLRV